MMSNCSQWPRSRMLSPSRSNCGESTRRRRFHSFRRSRSSRPCAPRGCRKSRICRLWPRTSFVLCVSASANADRGRAGATPAIALGKTGGVRHRSSRRGAGPAGGRPRPAARRSATFATRSRDPRQFRSAAAAAAAAAASAARRDGARSACTADASAPGYGRRPSRYPGVSAATSELIDVAERPVRSRPARRGRTHF